MAFQAGDLQDKPFEGLMSASCIVGVGRGISGLWISRNKGTKKAWELLRQWGFEPTLPYSQSLRALLCVMWSGAVCCASAR